MTESLVVVWALSVFLMWFVGYLRGYTIGVRETEVRWSEAVAKAEWHRKYVEYGGSNGRI